MTSTKEIVSGETAKELENIIEILVWRVRNGEGPAASRGLKATEVDPLFYLMSQKKGHRSGFEQNLIFSYSFLVQKRIEQNL